MKEALLTVEDLKKYFPITGGVMRRTVGNVKAVDGVSFSIKKGETFGLVGESGCGKSTTGRLLMRLIEPTDGRIVFCGKEITSMDKETLRRTRRDIQMVFQDPFASLNPRHTVEHIIEEPMIVHKIGSKEARRKRVKELLEVVGLNAYHAKRYPHQFSGGQRQRIGIARALAVNPKLIIADEPVSALDVSIQSQVINLMQDLQEQFDLTFLFIAHDLSVVRHFSDRVGVMYLGRLVEIADSDALYDEALHPYTKALLTSVPIPDPNQASNWEELKGDVPNPADPPTGCAFHTRCPLAMEQCRTLQPHLKEVKANHWTACHLYE
ncbi:ABC transporter ATP-binding protein [Camelliibacillus cellulosilyticus]|uniref:ABC transporter ATP-binding protein n=1 Tax=Camelliibacillus cellulosilyticus TaxID=2174486 RepID=A0ABV9GM76_9BACL